MRNVGWASALVRMPRFYFDLRQEGDLTVDEEGAELPDVAAARQEAVLAAAHLVLELFKGASFAYTIEIRDEHGKVVGRSTMSLDQS